MDATTCVVFLVTLRYVSLMPLITRNGHNLLLAYAGSKDFGLLSNIRSTTCPIVSNFSFRFVRKFSRQSEPQLIATSIAPWNYIGKSYLIRSASIGTKPDMTITQPAKTCDLHQLAMFTTSKGVSTLSVA